MRNRVLSQRYKGKNMTTQQTKQKELIELIDDLSQKAQSLFDQTRGLKLVIQTDFSENGVLSKESGQLAVMALARNLVLFAKWAKLDAQEVENFIVQQVKDERGIE